MIESLLILILVGAIAGWLAGQLVKGYGFGLGGNIVVGIVGSLVAGLLLPYVGFTVGGNAILASIIHATIGAVILLLLIRVIKRA
ncbi:GlsB/YeaQ/YmgE family stress response membrane protein [Xinfangfangia sp. D13-10-4-6]|uniref:GlsB/YeaQ/YmgE family stress response membrane protein n=1 Tax=Pseudogemmobacter hezensis TaxID=2737662 RepID=UPI0015557FF2|nr:GlsB/YeaQ/YmgE family stress response membrane protein [Pseudogemmobacter hezensis]NPD14431.1 GlsB/YeaQ/YmgE family stress response membrane protein [Pseudogemmobacter hezensis]